MRTYLGDVSCWMNSRQHFLSLNFSDVDPKPSSSCEGMDYSLPATSVKICFLNRRKGSHRDVVKFCVALRSGAGQASVRHSWVRNRHKGP
jgi:hypothetical protein